MATRRKPILVRTFRGEYKLDEDLIPKDYIKQSVKITYNPYTLRECDVYVNAHRIYYSSNHINHISRCKKNSDKCFRMLLADILKEVIYSSCGSGGIEFICKFISSEYYKTLKRDIKNVIKDFIDLRREELMRKIFFDRISVTNTQDRLQILKEISNTFAYVVVPRNGLFTESVKDLILVKSDPRNGYVNIIKRTLTAIHNDDSEFNIFKKDPYIQLNNELSENIIPYV